MRRKDNLAPMILVSVLVLVLTLLLGNVDVQAQIVFSSEMDGSWNIYTMDVNGRNQQKLTNTRRGNWHPSWSPDGKRIAFSSEMDGSWNIYTMDVNGRNQQKLTNTRRGNWHPSWFGPVVADVPIFAVAPAGKILTMWGWFKQIVQ